MKLKIVATIVGFIGCMLLGACWQKQHEEAAEIAEEIADSLIMDSIYAEADTLLLDKETAITPLPASVDEFFGDFIFNFDQSNRLQRNRIRFPLPIIDIDGNKRLVEKRDWKHHYMFLQQDFCTVFWKSRQDMNLAQDTLISEAQVEQIYLHSRQINSFFFQRDSNTRQWMMIEEKIIPFEETELGPFLDFYRQFASDSVFQRHHIANPLSFSTVDEENEFALIEGNINKEQWFEFKPDMPKDILVNIHYGQDYHHPHRLFLQMRGINNGLQSLFTFKRHGEQWRLTALEN